jgi:hypothetical protein
VGAGMKLLITSQVFRTLSPFAYDSKKNTIDNGISFRFGCLFQ